MRASVFSAAPNRPAATPRVPSLRRRICRHAAVALAAARHRAVPSCGARTARTAAAELAAGLALAVVAARVSSQWELAALTWLALIVVPLPSSTWPFTGRQTARRRRLRRDHRAAGRRRVRRPRAWPPRPRRHRRGRPGGFYLVLSVIRPGGLGLGDAKLATSVGAALGWISCRRCCRTFAAFALPGVYAGALLALHRATRTSQLPLGPFILLGTLAAIAL